MKLKLRLFALRFGIFIFSVLTLFPLNVSILFVLHRVNKLGATFDPMKKYLQCIEKLADFITSRLFPENSTRNKSTIVGTVIILLVFVICFNSAKECYKLQRVQDWNLELLKDFIKKGIIEKEEVENLKKRINDTVIHNFSLETMQSRISAGGLKANEVLDYSLKHPEGKLEDTEDAVDGTFMVVNIKNAYSPTNGEHCFFSS